MSTSKQIFMHQGTKWKNKGKAETKNIDTKTGLSSKVEPKKKKKNKKNNSQKKMRNGKIEIQRFGQADR